MSNEPLKTIGKLKQRLNNVEMKLNKNRPTVQEDGWQTQRYAKKARNWDIYAQEKMKVLQQIEICETKNIDLKCDNCDCYKIRVWKHLPDTSKQHDPYKKNKR